MKAVTEKSRHLILRLGEGDTLPEALLSELRDEIVICGWMRASGVLVDVELRAFRAELGGHGTVRRITGPVQVISMEGSIGLANGDVSCGLRAVLARETDRGMETLAGEIVAARVIGLEVLVTALDDVALVRAHDARAGVWLLGEGTPAKGASPPQTAARRPPESAPSVLEAAAPAAWGEAVSASEAPKARAAGSSFTATALPVRPVKPVSIEEELLTFPEAGDTVEHFAFGRCEVVKSDGDRLHLKVGKDSRVREIALEMLKVTPLESEIGKPRLFKLDRKL